MPVGRRGNSSSKSTDFGHLTCDKCSRQNAINSCSIAGSGSIKAYDLSTDTLNASIAGSGSIKITVSTKIKAKVVGSGSIYYKGNPSSVDSKSVGSGEVVDKN